MMSNNLYFFKITKYEYKQITDILNNISFENNIEDIKNAVEDIKNINQEAYFAFLNTELNKESFLKTFKTIGSYVKLNELIKNSNIDIKVGTGKGEFIYFNLLNNKTFKKFVKLFYFDFFEEDEEENEEYDYEDYGLRITAINYSIRKPTNNDFKEFEEFRNHMQIYYSSNDYHETTTELINGEQLNINNSIIKDFYSNYYRSEINNSYLELNKELKFDNNTNSFKTCNIINSFIEVGYGINFNFISNNIKNCYLDLYSEKRSTFQSNKIINSLIIFKDDENKTINNNNIFSNSIVYNTSFEEDSISNVFKYNVFVNSIYVFDNYLQDTKQENSFSKKTNFKQGQIFSRLDFKGIK